MQGFKTFVDALGHWKGLNANIIIKECSECIFSVQQRPITLNNYLWELPLYLNILVLLWLRSLQHIKAVTLTLHYTVNTIIEQKKQKNDWHWRVSPWPLWIQEAQTTAHVLQSCTLHKEEKVSTWPTESSLGDKLHRTATDLHLTRLHTWQDHMRKPFTAIVWRYLTKSPWKLLRVNLLFQHLYLHHFWDTPDLGTIGGNL